MLAPAPFLALTPRSRALRSTSGADGAASAFPDAGRANPADRGARALAGHVQ
jgi:hypothetical protein